RWPHGEPGAQFPRASLPLLTEERRDQFLAAAADVLQRKCGFRIRPGGTSTVKRTADQWREIIRDGAGENLRHDTILSIAGQLISRGVDPKVTLELMHAYNEARCDPPKPEDEVYKIVNWCAGKQLGKENG